MFTADYWQLANPDWTWIVVVAFIVAFVLAFGIGANDVANSFGSSVGAKVLTLKQACLLGTIFEILGAVLVGAKVSNTIRKGIISVDLFQNGTEAEFMVGNLAALSGSCIWMLFASFIKLPVSATHSIVGATIGFSLVARGLDGVSWPKLGMIIGSWFASPLLSGGISTGLFFFIYKFVLTKKNPLEPGLRLLPFFYAFTFAINLFSVFYKGSELLHFNEIPLYGTFILAFAPAIIACLVVRFIIVPWQRKKILAKSAAIARQKEEEGLIESDANYLNSMNKQQGTEFLGAVNKDELNKENLGTCPPKSTSTPAKKLPFGVHDSNIDAILEMATSKGNISMSSKGGLSVTSGYSALPLIKPSDRKDPAEGATNTVVDTSGTSTASLDSETSSLADDDKLKLARSKIKETTETTSLFSFLQVLTAIFGSFAHGGNDVSNAIGPLVALWITATTGSAAQKAPVPIWILLVGGVGIAVGLWVWGRRVMKTLGEDLTKITPSSGFCIEIGSALTVLAASNIGIPISTTHCKVGSVVFVGWFRSKQGVDWKLFRNIIIAWFVTLPVACGSSAAFMALFREFI